MGIKELEARAKRGFNNAMWVVALSHMWVIVYLLAGRVSSGGTLTAEGKCIIFITMVMLLAGIVVARRLNRAIIIRLLDSNQQAMRLQQKLIEKSKLAAITETTLTLSHEINNPLMIVRGNLEMLENDFIKEEVHSHIRDKLVKIKNHCERIRQITDKLANLSKPVEEAVRADTEMFDVAKPG